MSSEESVQAGVSDAAAAAGACFPKYPALRTVPATGTEPAGRPKGVRDITKESSDAAGRASGVCLLRSAHSRMLGLRCERALPRSSADIQFDFVNATDDCLLPATMALKWGCRCRQNSSTQSACQFIARLISTQAAKTLLRRGQV